MISNERVQALIACDRETLIVLMAVARSAGNWGGTAWDIHLDPDIKALLDAARMLNARPATLTPPDGWQTAPLTRQKAFPKAKGKRQKPQSRPFTFYLSSFTFAKHRARARRSPAGHARRHSSGQKQSAPLSRSRRGVPI